MIFSTSLYQLHFLFSMHLDGAMWLVLIGKVWIEYVTSRLIELGVGGPFLYSHIFVYSDLGGYNIGGVFLGLWNIVWSREHPKITEQWAGWMWVHNKLCYTTGIWVKYPTLTTGTPGGAMVKNLPTKAGDARDASLIPGSGRSPGEGNGNALQHSCLGNPIDREARRTAVYGWQRVEHDWARMY